MIRHGHWQIARLVYGLLIGCWNIAQSNDRLSSIDVSRIASNACTRHDPSSSRVLLVQTVGKLSASLIIPCIEPCSVRSYHTLFLYAALTHMPGDQGCVHSMSKEAVTIVKERYFHNPCLISIWTTFKPPAPCPDCSEYDRICPSTIVRCAVVCHP